MTPENTEKRPNCPEQPKKKRQRLSGVTRLYRASEKILRRDADSIANALLARALEGNVSSAKLLIKLIEMEAHRIRRRRRTPEDVQKERQKIQDFALFLHRQAHPEDEML